MAFRRKSGFVLAASNTDPAGITLGQSLISEGRFELAEETAGSGKIFTSGLYDNAILYTSNKSVLFMDDLDELFPLAEAFLFLSKHKSDSAIPTLTCHSVGNFSDNPYGGKPRELGIAFPSMQKKYMQTIFNGRSKVPGYDIVIEATHHGPTSLKKPAIFIELGSSEPQWVDAKAADYVCSSLLGCIGEKSQSCGRVAIGFGGTHYPSKFNKLLLESDIGLAAVASKHNLESIDEDMVAQMIERSSEQVTHALVDSKGLGGQKDRILAMLKNSGLEQISA
ncbi:MAG: D-aminoacyl-tRNA deacylase [Nitrososphaera sp.]